VKALLALMVKMKKFKPKFEKLSFYIFFRTISNHNELTSDHCTWDQNSFHLKSTPSHHPSVENCKPHRSPTSPTTALTSSTTGLRTEDSQKRDENVWFSWEAKRSTSIFRDEELVASLLQHSLCQKQQQEVSFTNKSHFSEQNQVSFELLGPKFSLL